MRPAVDVQGVAGGGEVQEHARHHVVAPQRQVRRQVVADGALRVQRDVPDLVRLQPGDRAQPGVVEEAVVPLQGRAVDEHPVLQQQPGQAHPRFRRAVDRQCGEPLPEVGQDLPHVELHHRTGLLAWLRAGRKEGEGQRPGRGRGGEPGEREVGAVDRDVALLGLGDRLQPVLDPVAGGRRRRYRAGGEDRPAQRGAQAGVRGQLVAQHSPVGGHQRGDHGEQRRYPVQVRATHPLERAGQRQRGEPDGEAGGGHEQDQGSPAHPPERGGGVCPVLPTGGAVPGPVPSGSAEQAERRCAEQQPERCGQQEGVVDPGQPAVALVP